MLSTRKQKAKERRSRQMDLMFDIKNVEVMLGSHSRNELEGNSGNMNDEVDSDSDRPRQDIKQNNDCYRSFLNSNSRENSETTIDTM